MTQSIIDHIHTETHSQTAENALAILARLFPGQVVFSSSLGLEDQVITHLIFSSDLPVKIFTLNTGRLFGETERTLEATMARYKKTIDVFYPNEDAVASLVSQKGSFSFFESVENRKECCFIRKVEPLKRALAGNKIWITGIRAEQSASRTNMPLVEWDEDNQIYKFHPLHSWSFEQIRSFIQRYNVPYNPLHDRGYVSIGCEPCTRAIRSGEDFRAGRWWWEQEDRKECGLHNIKTDQSK